MHRSSSQWLSTLAVGVLMMSRSAFGQDRTTEAGEAAITDQNEECTPYTYSVVTENEANFPTIWEQATIVSGDTVATALFASINSTLPDIAPRGTYTGNFTNVTYSATDPDCWWTYDTCTTPKITTLPTDISSIPEPKSLGYGFDDGPNCSHNAFYDFLASKNQKASLFYIGSNVMDWPLEAQRGVDDGHEVCVHTWSHEYMTALTNEAAFAELYYTREAIKLVTGVTPTCWRPPYGDVDDRIRSIAFALNLTTYIWGYDSFDWQVATGGVTEAQVDANYQTMVTDEQAGKFDSIGAIILTHELNNYTMSTAISWYANLSAVFNLVPVGVGLNKTQPYVETNYSLPTFSEYISGTTETNSSSSSGSASASAAGSSSTTSSGTSDNHSASGPAVSIALALIGAAVSVACW